MVPSIIWRLSSGIALRGRVTFVDFFVAMPTESRTVFTKPGGSDSKTDDRHAPARCAASSPGVPKLACLMPHARIHPHLYPKVPKASFISTFRFRQRLRGVARSRRDPCPPWRRANIDSGKRRGEKWEGWILVGGPPTGRPCDCTPVWGGRAIGRLLGDPDHQRAVPPCTCGRGRGRRSG